MTNAIKKVWIYALLIFITALFSCTDKTEEKKPNIIMFLVDDMGWQDTSLPFWKEKTEFNKRFHTPSMERLASEGMMFTQAYSCAVCSPTRVSLMSGMNAARHKVTNWTLYRNGSNDAGHRSLAFPKWNLNGIQPTDSIENTVYANMLPEILKDNGMFYNTCRESSLWSHRDTW